MFNFDQTKFRTAKALGQGSYSYVCPYTSEMDPNGDQSVVKKHTVDLQGLKLVIQEIAFGLVCKHPNILSIDGFDLHEQAHPMEIEGKVLKHEVYIKMPRMVESLQAKIARREIIPESQILKHFQEIASGLAYLHKQQIAHRSIKPSNVLLDKDGTVKIADIGLEKCFGDLTRLQQKYLAPEVIERGDTSKIEKDELCCADLWSLGLTILELYLSKELDILTQWYLPQNQELLSNEIFSLKGKYSDHLIDLIKSLLQYDPSQRIKIDELSKNLEQLNANSQSKKAMEEELGESMIISSEAKEKQEPGKVREEEKKDRGGSILIGTIRDPLQTAYGKDFIFEANETERSLNIKCQNELITDGTMYGLLKRMNEEFQSKNYKQLKSLALTIERAKNITNSGLNELALQIGLNFKSLTQLHLDFSNCQNIADSGIKELAAQVGPNLKDLTQLYLSFSRCSNITDTGIKELALQIGPNLKNLTQLYLDFSSNDEITDTGIKELALQIGPNLKSLTQLHLGFSRCKDITDTGINKLALQIGPNLKDLTKLHLDFSRCKYITDTGIKELALQIGPNLKDLTKLHLDFSLDGEITDTGINGLAMQIGSNLKNLTQLHLSFSNCQRIKDSGIKELALQIGPNLKNLTQLHLSFSHCIMITDSGLNELAKIGPSLINLNHVTFDFYGCRISQAHTLIKKSFAHVKSLQLKFK